MRALMASPARGATRALAPLRQRVARFRASPARAELLPVRSNPLVGAVGKDGKPLTVLSAVDGRPVSVEGARFGAVSVLWSRGLSSLSCHPLQS